MSTTQKCLLVVIILVAVFFRFYKIAEMPGGLFPDEAANGLDINLMEQGQLQPFYERGNGREALFFYMEWVSVAAFGRGPWQHHIVSALIGALAVVACFLVTRKLFTFLDNSTRVRWRATNLALLAAFLMAASTWHTVLSRTAFRANLIPLFTTLVFYFLLKIYTTTGRRRLVWAFITGASFALGFYTYIAYRVMAPMTIVLLAWPFLAQGVKENIKKYWRSVLLLTLGFVIFIYPLAKYFYSHPDSFIGRSGQVSVFNPDLNHGHLAATILQVSKDSFLAYFIHGDLNWRHNISGYPFLSPLVSPFFALGLLLVTFFALRYLFRPRTYARDWRHFLLAIWFWAMLLPAITTAEGIPHGLRSIGTIPAVFMITAFGLYRFVFAILTIIGRRHRYSKKWKVKLIEGGLVVLVPLFATAIILQTYFAYFVYAANSAENFSAFRSDLTLVSEFLKQYGNKSDTYLVLEEFAVQTTDYLTTVDGSHPDNPRNQPYMRIEPDAVENLSHLKPGDIIIFTQSSLPVAKKFKLTHPEARLEQTFHNKFGEIIMAQYIVK